MKDRLEYLAGVCLFGTLGVFRRMTLLPTGFIIIVRLVLGAAMMAAVLKLWGNRADRAVIRSNLKYLAVSGLAMGFYMIAAFESFLRTSVATATLCFYIAPIVIVLVSPLFFDEKVTPRKVICLIGALAGLVMVSGVLDVESLQPGEGVGIALALFVAFAMVVIMIANKKMAGIDGLERTYIQFLFAFVPAIPYVLISVDFGDLEFTAQSVLFLLLISVFSSGLGYILYFSGISKLPMQTSAMFAYFEPVTAVLLSYIVLGESLTITETLGAALLIGASVVCELENDKRGSSRKAGAAEQ